MLRYERSFTAAYDVTDWIGGGWSHFSIGNQVYPQDATSQVVGLRLNWNLSSADYWTNSPEAQLQLVMGNWTADNVLDGNWAFSRTIDAGDINKSAGIVSGSETIALDLPVDYAPKLALRVEAYNGASGSSVTLGDSGSGAAWSATMTLETLDFPLEIRQLNQNPYENDPGPQRFRVSLGDHGLPNATLASDVTFRYEIRHGTTDADDFAGATSGWATLRAGRSYVDIDVAIADDQIDESAIETYDFAITGYGDPSVRAQILDDDQDRYIGVSDLTVTEGDMAQIRVSLSAALDRDVTLGYRTIAGSAGDGSDFNGVSNGSVTIRAGQTRAEIDIPTIEDSWSEATESFDLRLTGILGDDTGLDITRQTAEVTIRDDDAPRSLSLGDLTLDPGGSGTVRVTMDRVADNDVFVRYRIDDATNADFAETTGEVIIAAGDSHTDIEIRARTDSGQASAQDFDLRLTGAGYGTAYETARGTVTIAAEVAPPRTSYDYIDSLIRFDGTSYEIPVFSFTDLQSYNSPSEFYDQNFFANDVVLPEDLPVSDAARLIGASNFFSHLLKVEDDTSFADNFGTPLGIPSALALSNYNRQQIEDFIFEAYFADNVRDSIKVALGGAMVITGIVATVPTGGASLGLAYAGAGLFTYGALSELADQNEDQTWANFYLQKLKEAQSYYATGLELHKRAVTRLEEESATPQEAGLQAMLDNLSADEDFLSELNSLVAGYYANTLLAGKIVYQVEILATQWEADERSGDVQDMALSLATSIAGQAGTNYRYVKDGIEYIVPASDSLALFADAAIAAAEISDNYGSWYSALVPSSQIEALEEKHQAYLDAVAIEVHHAINTRFGGDFNFFPDGTALDSLSNFLPDTPSIPEAGFLPDLQLRNVAIANDTFEAGDQISINYDVFNFGSGAAKLSVTGIFLSRDMTISADDLLIGAYLAPPLISTDVAIEMDRVAKLPSWLESGDYWIGVITDYSDRLNEEDEANNASTSFRIAVSEPTQTTPVITGVTTGVVGEDATLTVAGSLQADSGFAALTLDDFNEDFGSFWFNGTTGDWGYDLDNDAAHVQALPHWAEVTDTLRVTSLDGTAQTTVTVTIRGANDPASIAGDVAAQLQLDAPDETSAGPGGVVLLADDRIPVSEDYNAILRAQLGVDARLADWTDIKARYELEGGAFLRDAGLVPSDEDGIYGGAVTRDADRFFSGDRHYFISWGDVHSGFWSHDVATHDGVPLHLGSWYSDQRLIAELSGGAAPSGAGTSLSGQVTITDPDAGEERFGALDAAALQGDFGSFTFSAETGEWTYRINPDAPAVQALAMAEDSMASALTDSLTLTSLDGTATETLTITIHAPDAPADAPTTVRVAGDVQSRGGVALDGTEVILTSDTHPGQSAQTATGGRFALDVPQGGSGRLDATRAYNPDTDGAVTAQDALDTLRLSMGLTPSWGPVTALDYLAADIDRDGQVAAADALDILRAAVGLDSPHMPRWIFIDSDSDLTGIDPSNTAVETGIAIDPLLADLDGIGLTGILLGNVTEHV